MKIKKIECIFIIISLLAFYASPFFHIAEASSSSTNSPGTLVDNSAVGSLTWADPSNATGSNNSYAIATGSSLVQYSHYLKATNFGFSIPSGATINGILVEVEKKQTGSGSVRDYAVKIVKSDGNIGTANKGYASTEWPWTDTYISYPSSGADTDLWGESWSESDIEDSDFGVVLQVKTNSPEGLSIANVDHIQITVYYTEVAGPYSGATDIMTIQQPSNTSDHAISWTLGATSKNTVGDTIALDFVVADYVPSGTWQTSDFSFTGNAGGPAPPASVGTGSVTCSGSSATNYIVNVDASNATFTITLCTGWTQSTVAFVSSFSILGASGGTGTLTNKSSNVESSLLTITDTGDDTDVFRIAIVVETNDVVTVTATVNPTLSLAISSASIALSTITASTTGSGSHTAQVATNATGGFLLTYNGPTLTATGGTIAAYGTQQSSVAGTAGFGINMVDNATPNIGTNFVQNSGTCASIPANYGTADKYSYVANSTIALTNQSTPADCTYTISYIGNISSTTPAGNYTTPITYIATGTF